MDRSNKKPVNLNEILRPLRRNKLVVMVSFFSVVSTVVFLTFISERVYEASATLSLREGEDLQGQLFNIPSVLLTKYHIKNQVTILESRTLAAVAVKKLQESVYKDSLEILGNIPKKKTLTLREKVISWWSKKRPVQKRPSFQAIIARFRSSTKVVYSRDSDIIGLKGRSSTPWEAAYIVNKWVEAYQDYNRADSQGEVVQTRKFLETKLSDMEKKLVLAEEKLTRYQKENKVVSLSDETEQLVIQLANFESIYKQTMTELESVENQLKFLKSQLDESKKNFVEDMVKLSNSNIKELQRQMTELEAEKAAYEAQILGAGYNISRDAKLTQMENRLTGIKQKIIEETKKLVDRDLTRINPLDYSESLITQILDLEITQKSLSAKTQVQKSTIDEYIEKFEKVPDKMKELARLERDVQVNNKIYILLREKFEEIKIREAGQVGMARVVDLAEPSKKPVYPKTRLNILLGCFFGILLGVGFAFGREYFDDSVRNKEDLEELGIQVIGRVPACKKEKSHISNLYRHKDWNILRAREILQYIINQRNGPSTIAEAYRAIRTTIYFMKKQKQWKTILLTSSGPAEGKSTTAANLAIWMAQKGVKTLLVDSDLRKPVLDIIFIGTPKKVGLTNHLAHELKWQDAVRETTTEGLYILAAGPRVKNASEVLSSRSMQLFIEETKKEYGLIIFDSPPLLPVTDATVLASVVDAVILVAKVGKTSRKAVRYSMDLLKNVGAQFFGAVLTGAPYLDLYKYQEYYPYRDRKQKK